MDGMLLQTVEGLGDPPPVVAGGALWEHLQAEKEEVSREIIDDDRLFQIENAAAHATEPSEESAIQIEWRHRAALTDRLRAINDAQDRLIDGGYGICFDCGARISSKRLVADPATSLCIECQGMKELDRFAQTL